MAIRAISHSFEGAISPINQYDPQKTNLGSLIKQYTGLQGSERFVGPLKIGMARPMEAGVAIPAMFPHVIPVSSTKDWIFFADGATAAATRRIIAYEFNRETSVFNWLGYVTLTFPTTGNITIRGFRAFRQLYSAGTITVNGTNVYGINTAWQQSRLSVGSRIGFGSTDPNQITNWYEITGVSSDSLLTLNINAGTINENTPYVIEDLMCVLAVTNATATNGGVFIVKGLNIDIFGSGATIPAATTIDNIRAVYWLADAATLTNTAIAGCAMMPFDSWTDQKIYCIDTNRRVYVYNVRAALSLSAGRSLNAFAFSTGILATAFTGTLSQVNNGRIATLAHGPGQNTPSLYFVTTTRVYRAALSLIVDGSTTWVSDIMVEIPPGGINTYAATSVLSNIEYDQSIDRLVIMSTGAAAVRNYITRYNTNSEPFDHIFLIDDKQLDQSSSDSGGVPHPTINALPFTVWSENGLLFLCRTSAAANLNQVYTLPIGAHRRYAFDNNQYLIAPKFNLGYSNKLLHLAVRIADEVGSDTFSLPPEPFTVYYRTAGIDDNSGQWIEVPATGDLSGLVTSQIQFAIAFKVIGTTCIPSRIFGLALLYEDAMETDSHYEASVTLSSVTDRAFAFRQSNSFGTNIPDLRIRLINAETGIVVIDDNISGSQYGTWEYSSNEGVTWQQWNPEADQAGNYIRYVANSIPPGNKLRVLLTQ